MTDRDAGAESMSNEEAAELVRNDPALGAGEPDPHGNNEGVDDDATTPDAAVSNEE
jgi:hypothetical protein